MRLEKIISHRLEQFFELDVKYLCYFASLNK